MENNKRAVLYFRVSTKEQVENNSLTTQERICREFAQKNGYTIVQTFVEGGESAKTADRTELKKLMHFCASKKNNISTVIYYKIDRFARDRDDYGFLRLSLRGNNIKIVSATEPFDDTPAGHFMESVVASVAQLDNEVRTERSVNGLREAVREGRYVWPAPLGYKNAKVNGKSNIVPTHHAPLVKEAFIEVAKDALPVEVVRRNMNKRWHTEYGIEVSRLQFYRMLKKELYTGWIVKFGERKEGCYTPLISTDLFEQVQYVISERKKNSAGYTLYHPDFPLRRFLYHPTGVRLTGAWSTGKSKKYPYYFYRMPKHMYPKEMVDNAFVEFLNQYKMEENLFGKLVIAIKKGLANRVEANKGAITLYEEKKEQIKQRQRELIQKNLKGILPDDLLKEHLDLAKAELVDLQNLTSQEKEKLIQTDLIIPLFKEFVEHPANTWKNAYYKGKIRLQWFFFPKGVIFDGKECRTPETCSLFKLKDFFLPKKYHLADHLILPSNTTDTPQSPSYDDNIIANEVFLMKINKELLELSEIKDGIYGEDTTDYSLSL